MRGFLADCIVREEWGGGGGGTACNVIVSFNGKRCVIPMRNLSEISQLTYRLILWVERYGQVNTQSGEPVVSSR